MNKIVVKGARVHNLKGTTLEIPRESLTVITGVSGSGKSSLAFDTLYAEGQRRYVESLSSYARQFLELMEKPDVDSIEGLSPAISIEQKTTSKNPRSTVGTVTEIYDYLRLLYARVGVSHCHKCGAEITPQTIQQMVDQIMELGTGTRIMLFSPIARWRKGEYRKEFEKLGREGFTRVRVDGELFELSNDIVIDKKKKHDIDVLIDRIVIKENVVRRLADSLEVASGLSDGVVKVEVIDGGSVSASVIFSEKLSCVGCGVSYTEFEPTSFSFNSPNGACPECDGLGNKFYFDPDLVVPDRNLSLREGALAPWGKRNSIYLYQIIDALATHLKFDIYTPFNDLSGSIQDALLYGNGDDVEFYYMKGGRRYTYRKKFFGILKEMERRYVETESYEARRDMERYMNSQPCPSCHGSRLKRDSLFVKIAGCSIHDVTRMSIKDACQFFTEVELEGTRREIGRRILKEIVARLEFLNEVGLGYLTLDRPSATISGGEGQRIRLATQIGSGLVGVLYVLDEPSIGLHQRDNKRMLNALTRLKNMGNTLLVVEHDEETIRMADHVIDMGPGAGENGGYVVSEGKPEDIMKDSESLTGRYLSGALSIPVPRKRVVPDGRYLGLSGASENNLKSIDVKIPVGLITCVTGVSGSGKSTLVVDTLFRVVAQRLYGCRDRAGRVKSVSGLEFIDKVIDIDQSPIGRTPRSNPSTYTGLFTPVRELFAQLPDSRIRGYKQGRFSFNVKGGRCEACEGDGLIKVEMHFLPDLYVTCDQCKGKRYNRETLEIRFKGNNIADCLEMTVNKALLFFERIPHVRKKLQTLCDVGLGYIKLGQSATTLSGGEAQRIKLSRELSKRSTGRTLYILDEPTTGLHFADIQKLLDVLQSLRNAGNTIVVIEHNLDVVKTSDHLIDLGPEGGDKGGEIVAKGTPEEVSLVGSSHTGVFLRKILSKGGDSSERRHAV